MRKHGKLAVMKDDEVDRLERAGTAVSGATRQEVMESMYGRVDPKPKGMFFLLTKYFVVIEVSHTFGFSIAEPIYSIEERQAMKQKEQEMKEAAHEMALIPSSYRQIDVPQDLGLDCGSYKWKQNQTYVEIYILLPYTDSIASKVVVELKPGHISVEINERPFLRGPLYREIKAEDSTWYIQDGVLEITLLKYSRRGQYANGETNADTFWKSVLKTAQETEIICLQHPPSNYYTSYYEVDGQQKRLVTGRKK